jgi:hypothetical protein
MTKADGATDDVVQDDPAEPAGAPPSLDQVHTINQAQVEKEDEDAAEEEDQDADAGDDDTTDGDGSGEGDGDADAGSDTEGTDDQDAGDSDDEGAGSDNNTDTPPAKTPEPTTQLDSDISKNGEGKVAIKDAEGKTFYFNNLDEVPDDFEPASYKSLMIGTKALMEKEQNDKKAEADRAADEVKQAHIEATQKMQDSWESDASELVRSGAFPNDPKKLEAAKSEVYDYIESELKKGNVITSFNQAYKSMMYDKQQQDNKDKQKEIDDAKKKRGGIVQSGSGANASDTKGARGNKVIEAPPAGVGLDAVHARAISTL